MQPNPVKIPGFSKKGCATDSSKIFRDFVKQDPQQNTAKFRDFVKKDPQPNPVKIPGSDKKKGS